MYDTKYDAKRDENLTKICQKPDEKLTLII